MLLSSTTSTRAESLYLMRYDRKLRVVLWEIFSHYEFFFKKALMVCLGFNPGDAGW